MPAECPSDGQGIRHPRAPVPGARPPARRARGRRVAGRHAAVARGAARGASPGPRACCRCSPTASTRRCSTPRRGCGRSRTWRSAPTTSTSRRRAERGIPVGNTPDVLTDATADLAFALLLALARRIVPGRRAGARRARGARGSRPATSAPTSPARRSGSSAGGGSARPWRARAEGFGMEVVHSSRSLGRAARGAARARRLRLPAHAADAGDAAPDRRGRARAHEADRAAGQHRARRRGRPGRAARARCTTGAIAGAALDVTDPEPLPADDPLLDAPNLLVVPHVGSATVRTRAKMAAMAVENLLAALDGRPMPLPGRMTRVAVVDIGTNSTRLLVAEVGDGGADASSRASRSSRASARASTRPGGSATSRRRACSPRSTQYARGDRAARRRRRAPR